MISKDDPRSLKEILASFGYSVVRITEAGKFKGVQIHRKGRKVHRTHLTNYDFGLRLANKADYVAATSTIREQRTFSSCNITIVC